MHHNIIITDERVRRGGREITYTHCRTMGNKENIINKNKYITAFNIT